MQEAHKSAIFLTFSAEWGKTNDDNEMLWNTEFAAEEKELKYYAGLAQKQLDRYIQKV